MAPRPPSGFPMSELVRRTGVPPATVRYYTSVGVVPPARRVARNRFLYDERHVESVRLVRLLRERRQLPLETIARMLPELLEASGGGVFRPEMWDQLVDAHARSAARSSPASRLLDAGRAAFNRHGYAEVRVDDVCQAARVAKGSFYRHFASKEELFFAAAVAAGDQAARSLEEAAGAGPLLPDDAVELLSRALQPDLALLLDLVTMTAQRRPGHGRVLRQIFTSLYRVVRSRLSLGAAGGAEDVLERALLLGLRRVVVSPLLDAELFPGEAGL
jgi:AcrR family transcriptional regulator